ncbi:hypothetical protein CRYUN_Cryun16bG0020100 [Craigia yunnanensis]
MDRVFSVEEISDHFWSSSSAATTAADVDNKLGSKMNRSASEWAFQQFLREEVDKKGEEEEEDEEEEEEEAKEELKKKKENGMASSFNGCLENNDNNNNVPVNVEEYQAFLKNKLNLACAAVAMSRASFVKSQDSAARADCGSQASDTQQLVSKATSEGVGEKDGDALVGIPSLPNGRKKSRAQMRPSTSGSSREQSEDDEVEGENETMENMDPSDSKRVRRMLSNRESARRSRRRKQTHLTELETQASQLRVENGNLLKRLTDISQKYNEAAVDNRVLKADVETLRAKVQMAEEAVKRITGLNPVFHASPEISTMGMSSFDGSPSDTSTDAGVPVQDGPKQPFNQVAANIPISTHNLRIDDALTDISSIENIHPNSGGSEVTGNKIGQTAFLQRVASLEHLQKRICGVSAPV